MTFDGAMRTRNQIVVPTGSAEKWASKRSKFHRFSLSPGVFESPRGRLNVHVFAVIRVEIITNWCEARSTMMKTNKECTVSNSNEPVLKRL